MTWIQDFIIFALFIGALGYIGYQVYKSFQAKTGCSSGCGSCGIDFSKIQRGIKKEAAK